MKYERMTERADGTIYCKDTYDKIIDRLAEYEDLEEQGLLVRLPCKVGDDIYYIIDFGSVAGECFDLEVGKIKSISLQEDGWWIYAVYDGGLTYWHNVDKKDYYLIKAEAEKKLKELKGEE